MTSAPAACEMLDWDSGFWGFPVARVTERGLSPDAADAVDAWCTTHAVRCVYLLADAEDADTHATAQAHRFVAVDERVDLRATSWSPGNEIDSAIRPHRALDIPLLAEIASSVHRNTRFFNDPHFSPKRAAHLYRTWIERSCSGWADFVLVAELEGTPVGYVTGHRGSSSEGAKIGLLGIAASARGRGLGRRLLDRALAAFSADSPACIDVATQRSNIDALTLYHGAGFRPVETSTWFHKWFHNG